MKKRVRKRYSTAFKRKVVREVETGDLSVQVVSHRNAPLRRRGVPTASQKQEDDSRPSERRAVRRGRSGGRPKKAIGLFILAAKGVEGERGVL